MKVVGSEFKREPSCVGTDRTTRKLQTLALTRTQICGLMGIAAGRAERGPAGLERMQDRAAVPLLTVSWITQRKPRQLSGQDDE